MLLVMLLGVTLMLLYLNRALMFEQRSAALLWREALAFEAAEAGRNWALAYLNHDRSIDAACHPTASSGGTWSSLRERLLARDASSGLWLPTTIQAGCALGGDNAWACTCPLAGSAHPAMPTGTAQISSFSVSLRTGDRPGSLVLESRGCVGVGSTCDDTHRGDAQALVRIGLATVRAALVAPAATLVAGGSVTLAGPVSLVNAEAAQGGLAVDSGGSIGADAQVQLIGPSGSPGSMTTVANDPRWTGSTGSQMSGDEFFAAQFGLSRMRYRDLPSLTRLACNGVCDASSVDTALAAGARALWIDGGLSISAVQWGSVNRPILLIVDGPLTVQGPARLHAQIYTRSVTWSNSDANPGTLRGALVSEGNAVLTGQIAVAYDATMLAKVAQAGALYAQVPGSWRDFND
jgi:Tfp pilus assembly protein PilX